MQLYIQEYPKTMGEHTINSKDEEEALIAEWKAQGITYYGYSSPPAEEAEPAPTKRGPGRPRIVSDEEAGS